MEGVLARHLAAHRKRQTETVRAALLLAIPTQEPLDVLPKNVALRQAKREERLAGYQHVIARRSQGFSQTAIAQYVGVGHAAVSRWLSNGTFPEQKPRPRSASVDPYLPHLVERWKAGTSTVAELYRELVADGYSHQYNSVYWRLARSFPEGQKKRSTRFVPSELKKREETDQHPQPPVLARQAMFLFRSPGRKNSQLKDKRRLLSFDRCIDASRSSLCVGPAVRSPGSRTRTGEQLDDWLSHAKASEIRELQGFLDFRETGQSRRDGRTHASTKQWSRRRESE